MTASVIVPTYGRPAYLKDALVPLLQQSFPSGKYEIIVVDNKPTGEVRHIVQGLEQGRQRAIRCVEEPNVGLTNARHAGAREALGEILVYVDDDVIVHAAWLEALLEPFADPQVGCVGGKIIAKWEVEPPAWIEQFPKWYLGLLDYGEDRKELTGEVVHGGNMAVRRSVLYEVGGFNPDLYGSRSLIWFIGDGEGGLQEKVYAAGYKVVYEPKAWVYHYIPRSHLIPEFFYAIAFKSGIDHSYNMIRNHHPSRTRMLCTSLICFLRAAFSYLGSFRSSEAKLRRRQYAWYWYAKAQHQVRVVVNARLRRHVLQDRYI